MIDMYLRKNLLNIKLTPYEFLVVVCLFYNLKHLDGSMLPDPGIQYTQPSKEQANTNRCRCSYIAHISNVEFKNVDNCEDSNEKLMLL